MNKQMKKKQVGNRKWNGGFTLIELIAVMAIMALLAGIAVPSYLGFIRKAKEQQHLAEARQMSMAVTMMMLENENINAKLESSEQYMNVFWKKIGDQSHPLYGSLPSSWDPKGVITTLLVDNELKLKEIGYSSPGGSGEVWVIRYENGTMQVEVQTK